VTTPGTYKTLHFKGSDLWLEITVEDPTPICILEQTKILTPDSYKLISELRQGDFVISAKSQKPVSVIDVGNRVVSPEDAQEDNVPCVFEKGVFGNGFPLADLYLSGYHALFLEPRDGALQGYQCI
jgi:hypothetical protein